MKIALATLLLIGAADPAAAAIIHFTNPAPGEPGHYDWHWVGSPLLGPIAYNWLDITKSPQDQTNTINGDSVGQGGRIFDAWIGLSNGTSGGAFVTVVPDPPYIPQTQALLFGDPLTGFTYEASAEHVYLDFESSDDFSLIPAGERRYIGVQISGGRYGWIEVMREPFSVNLTAYSWAYETRPGVFLFAGQIPTPGSAALFGIAAIAGSARRRRRA